MPSAIEFIAANSGCQTQQAFHKQFKSIVGMTPMEYRQSDTYFYFHPLAAGGAGGRAATTFAVKVGAEPIPGCDTARFYDPCLDGIEDRALASLGSIAGRVFGRNGKQLGSRFCYELMTENGTPARSGAYATCTAAYDGQSINSAWNYLYNTWLPASMFEQTDEGYFEEYLFKNGAPYKLRLYLPVRRRRAAQCIAITELDETRFVVARECGPHAEHMAAERVTGYLRGHFPLLLRAARRFYVHAGGSVYECGVECGGAFRLQEDSGLQLLRVPAGRYAVLPDDCLGDVRAGAERLDAWAANNGFAGEGGGEVFAVYETRDGSYDADSVGMKLYKRLKEENDKNG